MTRLFLAGVTKWVYTFLLVVGGLAFGVILPPLQTADEATHLIRGAQLARGEIRGEVTDNKLGCWIPSSLVTDLRSYRGMIAKDKVGMDAATWRILYERSGTIRGTGEATFAPCQFEHYAPVAHLPVTIAVAIGKLGDLSTVTTLYLGRLVNLLIACGAMLVVFALLENRPRVQLLAFAIAGAPANLSLFASLSADPITLVTALLVFALALRLRVEWTERTFWVFLCAAAVLGLNKNVYFPLAALSFPAIWFRAESYRKRLARMAMVVAAAIVPLALWMLYIRDLTSQQALALSATTPRGQLEVILESPLGYVKTWVSYLWNDALYLRRSAIGHMGWGDNSIPGSLSELYLIGLGLVALVGRQGSCEKRFDWIDMVWRLALCVVVAFLIYTALFVMGGRVAVPRTQGRYYMPLVPLVFASVPIAIYLTDKAFRRWRVSLILLWITAVIISAIHVTERYWGERRVSYWLGEMEMTHRSENGRRASLEPREDGDFVLRGAAPSVFDLQLPRKDAAASVEFGILNGAWRGNNMTDGVEFSVAASSPGRASVVIWRRLLTPRDVPGDRGPQHARFEIPRDATRLTLRTSPGPAGDNRWDWAYWRRLEFAEEKLSSGLSMNQPRREARLAD